jgi:hypothetical protein
MSEMVAAYDRVRNELSALIEAELAPLFPQSASLAACGYGTEAGLLARLIGRREAQAPAESPSNGEERHLVAEWDAKADAATDPIQKAAYRALERVVSALLIRHDRVWGSRELIASLARTSRQPRGGDAIGAIVSQCIAEAARTKATSSCRARISRS